MLEEPHPRHRPRPLGLAAVEALAGQVSGLAKRWLLELIASAPLEQAAQLPLAEMAQRAPRLLEVVVRALGDDRELSRLEPDGPRSSLAAGVGAMTGAGDAAEISRAVDALHAVVWSAALGELARASAREIVELSERLALVVATLRASALEGAALGKRERTQPDPGVQTEPEPEPAANSVDRLELAARLRDLSRPEEPLVASGEPEPLAGREPFAGREPHVGREPLSASSGERFDWIATLEAEIHRARVRAERLALILVELDDAERLLGGATDEERDSLPSRFAGAVRRVLRPGDVLAMEDPLRGWVIARDTGRVAARALAGRIGRALEEADPWRGAPLRITAGVALLGEDGSSPGTLIDAAEVARFAAAASGLTVAGREGG